MESARGPLLKKTLKRHLQKRTFYCEGEKGGAFSIPTKNIFIVSVGARARGPEGPPPKKDFFGRMEGEGPAGPPIKNDLFWEGRRGGPRGPLLKQIFFREWA